MQSKVLTLFRHHWNTIVLLASTFTFLAYAGFLAHSTSQSQRFGDEVAHMIGGHFVNKGEVLYEDLQFNHQPLPYLFSAFTEKTSSPENLYYYIAHQREGVFVYGALWVFVFVFMFGYRGLAFGLIFETSKYFFQGNKLLAESLAAYPVAYLLFLMCQILLEKKKPNSLDLFIASISLFIVTFSLSQLWIFAVIIGIVLLFYAWKNHKGLFALVGPALFLSTVLFIKIPFDDYFRETITYVFDYFFPSIQRDATLLSTILFPFTTFIPPFDETSKMLIAVAILCMMFYLYMLSKKVKLLNLVFITCILWTANTRADADWFDSFHLLPWFGGLIAVLLSYGYYYLHYFKSRKLHVIGHTCVLLLITLWLMLELPNPIEAKKQILNENYINYSYSETVGRAVKILKQDNDKLLVIDNDPIIYWVGGVDNATHVLEYYSWVLIIPRYHDEVVSLFKTNPPTFVVNTGFFNNKFDKKADPNSLSSIIGNRVLSDYKVIKHDNKSLVLYIRKDRLSAVTNEQRKELEEMLFYLPQE